jgi:TonB family protein
LGGGGADVLDGGSGGAADGAQPDESGAYWPGDGVKSPKLVLAAPADYPADSPGPNAKESRTLSAVVGIDGTISKIQVPGDISERFNQAVILAIEKSRFAPGTFDGEPVAAHVLVRVPIEPGTKSHRPTLVQVNPTIPQQYDHPPVRIPTAGLHEGLREPGRADGVVLVSVYVTEDGVPTNLHIMQSANHELDQDALQEVGHYRFQPASMEGIPNPATITIAFDFRVHKGR